MFERNLFGEEIAPDKHGAVLSQTWEYPPFSVLNAREGWWQERKRQWLALGIQSELGRGGGILMGSVHTAEIDHYKRKRSIAATASPLGKGTSGDA